MSIMEFHEKSLELNITHELLNLADSFYWFLTDIPLWRYWRPRYRLPFLKYPKSTSGGFHITMEGKSDPTGLAGGGYDVRIKSGNGGHLLFIQYKKGELFTVSPDPQSEFAKSPHEHFKFQINSTSTDQHFVLRELASGIGSKQGNAVVYAFPLIADMKELEDNSGRLVRKTKFISINDLDEQAVKNNVTFTKGQEHNFRVGRYDSNRCEVNYYYYYYDGPDQSPNVIADIIAIGFQKHITQYMKSIQKNMLEYELSNKLLSFGLQQAFVQYIRYLFHYFEMSPKRLENRFLNLNRDLLDMEEYEYSEGNQSDVTTINTVFSALIKYDNYIYSLVKNPESMFDIAVPQYEPQILFYLSNNGEINVNYGSDTSTEAIESINYLVI